MKNGYLINALPGACIPKEGAELTIRPIEAKEVPKDITSAIGHADTAGLVSGLVGFEIPMNRTSVPPFEIGRVDYLALYQGPRLPEGSTTLPEGATVNFYRLAVMDCDSCKEYNFQAGANY